MGASSSTLEDDKALQLCRERKRFVRQALDGRCSLAAAHFSYIESLRNVGTALSNFVQPGATAEPSAYTSMGMAPELHARNGRSNSQFSFSSSSFTHHGDAPETLQLTPSPPPPPNPNPVQFQANYMKTSVSSSITVEEKPFPSARTVRSTPSTPQNQTPQSTERPQTPEYEDSHVPPEDSPWDYFGLLHPIDRQFSFQDVNVENLRRENTDDFRWLRQEEGIPDLEEEKASLNEHIESEESEDEFEEPAADTLVQKFENRRDMDTQSPSTPSSVATPKHKPSETSISSESKILNRGKSDSYIMQKTELALTPAHEKGTPVEERSSPNNATPKDFVSSIKEIEHLFVMASDSGKEVPRMLEANKLHFRPIFTGKEGRSVTSTFLKACFSCGDDPTQAPEELPPPVTATKYLTWHRTASSRSSSSRNPLGSAQRSDVDDVNNNIFENFYMNSGSHASTLDRLYAWERKLYDEVKDSTIIRREYDMKCRQLREQDSKGEIENTHRVDKTRATVKDLYSRIRVAIQRIDSISKRIEELRDKELQPQLEELIEGLNRMWEKMFECHKQQFNIIKVAYVNGTMKISIHSESHRQATMQLEYELKSFSSSFKEWIIAQKHYLQSINGWLHKCVSLQQKTSRRKRRIPDTPLRNLGPPIYVTCGDWLDKLEHLPSKEVSDSVKALTIVTTHFLPRPDKKRGKNMKNSLWMDSSRSEMEGILPRGESHEELDLGYDRFQASLVTFLDRLNSFSMFSVNMYREIQEAIVKAKEREMRTAH